MQLQSVESGCTAGGRFYCGLRIVDFGLRRRNSNSPNGLSALFGVVRRRFFSSSVQSAIHNPQ